jgi:hypothetical protein
VIVVFFAVVTLFVKACDRIVGPDESSAPVVTDEPQRHLEPELAA